MRSIGSALLTRSYTLRKGLTNKAKLILLPKNSPNAEFWMSHLLLIISTVFGVYLAALQGFEVGIKLNNASDKKASYQVQAKLLDEVQYNLERLDTWLADIKDGNLPKYRERPDAFNLSTVIWESLRQQPAAMDLPRDALTRLRRFYTRGPELWGNLTSTDVHRNTRDDLTTLVAETRDTVVPRLKGNLAELEEELERIGIQVDN